MKIIFRVVIILIFSTISLSCVSRTVVSPHSVTIPTIIQPKVPGIYHKVAPQETLWRIAKTYNIELDEIIRVNRIPNAAKINKGQLIFIPGATEQRRMQTVKTTAGRYERFIWPAKGKIIAYFGQKFNGRETKGINIRLLSEENIFASRSGRVSFSGEIKGYGKSIIIEHGDNLSSVYTNNSNVLVKPRDYVEQGMIIAKASRSRSTSNYLHFEIRKENKPQNPLHYLP
ncbi:peptidoglycan DD-metalloendopeptidase family protein [Candidatus Omnitrophota bacterium]